MLFCSEIIEKDRAEFSEHELVMFGRVSSEDEMATSAESEAVVRVESRRCVSSRNEMGALEIFVSDLGEVWELELASLTLVFPNPNTVRKNRVIFISFHR